MAVDDAPTLLDAPAPPEGNARPEVQAGDYPALFRALLVRSVESALASIAPDDPKLDDDARERSLYALSLALDLAEAWPAASQLLLTIAPHMEMQGYWREWLEFLEKALERAVKLNDQLALARIHLNLGRIRHVMADYAIADQNFASAEECARCCGDMCLAISAVERMAASAVTQSNLPLARELARKVIHFYGSENPDSASAYSIQGIVAYQNGELDVAIDNFKRSLELHRSSGSRRFVAQATLNLALTYRYAGRHGEAGRYLEETGTTLDSLAEISDSFGNLQSIADQADVRMNLGVEYWHLGQYQKALDCFAACEPVFTRLGQKSMVADLANNRGLVYQELGEYAQAEQEFALGVELARSLGNHQVAANTLESWGSLYHRCKRSQDASDKWREALAELELLPEPPRQLYRELLERLGIQS